MLTIILLSISLPVLAGTAYLALRNRRPQLVADIRGIALQTVIIMVVLLAIAGAVAGVLVTRGQEATTDLRDAEITDFFGRFTDEESCTDAGGTWTAGNTPECAE